MSLHLPQPTSSDPSKQSDLPSQWKLLGTHCWCVLQANSTGEQGLEGSEGPQFSSSEPSPQSSSPSHIQLSSMHLRFGHWNSFGSQRPFSSEKGKFSVTGNIFWCCHLCKPQNDISFVFSKNVFFFLPFRCLLCLVFFLTLEDNSILNECLSYGSLTKVVYQ